MNGAHLGTMNTHRLHDPGELLLSDGVEVSPTNVEQRQLTIGAVLHDRKPKANPLEEADAREGSLGCAHPRICHEATQM